MRKGKITRKQMKRDDFARTVGGMTATLERYRKSLLIALIAVLLLGGAAYAGWRYSVSRYTESMLELADVQKAETRPVGDSTAADPAGTPPYATHEQKYEDVIRLADVVLADHPGSHAATWARYYKALGEKELGRFGDALTTLEPLTVAGVDGFVASSARLLKAHILEAQGDLDGAAEEFGRLAEAAPDQFPADLALVNQARLLELRGKIDEAREVYRHISEDYPKSPFAGEATRKNQEPG